MPEYAFYSSTNETFPMIDYMLEHKTSIDKVKNIKIVLSIVSDHNMLKLEINWQKKNRKSHKYVEFTQHAIEASSQDGRVGKHVLTSSHDYILVKITTTKLQNQHH